MTAKLCASLLLLTAGVCASPAMARPVPFRTYEQMVREADVVLIASATATRDTDERTELPGIAPPLRAVGIETRFQVSAVLKGKWPDGSAKSGKGTFVLRHFRLPEPAMPLPNGPGLVRFDPGSRDQYLMFLTREPDGRYRALSGQTDPDLLIEKLKWQR